MSCERLFVVSHPTGNTFVRALLEELQKKQQLEKFHTTIGFGLGINPLLKPFIKRRGYSINDERLTRQWFPELFRLISKGTHEKKRKKVDTSYLSLDKKVSKELKKYKAKVLHAYEDGASYSFKKAKELGIECSYELPIAYWATNRRLLAEEAERYPEWEPTLETTREPEVKLVRKEKELALADRITCPSNFVLQSIPKDIRDRIPCQVSPFGSPSVVPSNNLITKRASNNLLKLLFVGSMSQRKGLADLIEAMKLLRSHAVKLSILGQPSQPLEFYRKQLPDFHYFSPRSNEGVRKIMNMHDILVLPSIVEGRALVQQEALACGLPIIVTPNAGGEDLVEEGITGSIIPIRSPQKIAESILIFLDNIKSLDELRAECQRKAKEYTWWKYASSILDFNMFQPELHS